jgi:hypothetical protein
MRFRKGDVIYAIILSAVVHLFLERSRQKYNAFRVTWNAAIIYIIEGLIEVVGDTIKQYRSS